MVTTTFLAYTLGFGSGMFALLCVMVALRLSRVNGYKVSYMGHWAVGSTPEKARKAFDAVHPDASGWVTCTPVRIMVLMPLSRLMSDPLDRRDVSTFFRKLGKQGAFGKPAHGRI